MTNISNIIRAEDYWQYALKLYCHGTAQSLCLQLQDDYGCNVNMLLFCCYLERVNIALSKAAIAHIQLGLISSEEKLKALRAQRRAAKSGSKAHYEQLKAEELTFERNQQKNITEMMQSFIAIDAEKNNNFTSSQSNLLVYASALSENRITANDRISQLILDLDAQHQSLIQTESNAK